MMKKYAHSVDGEKLTIGVVQAQFSDGIGSQLLEACLSELTTLGVKKHNIEVAFVAGALEIPIILQIMAKTQKFDALIALGVIIRGETYHFELVSNESGAGVSRVSLDFTIPIANAILTTENEAQAIARMNIKGREAAVVAVKTANLQKKIQTA